MSFQRAAVPLAMAALIGVASGAVSAAPSISVEEAVIPDWPGGARKGQRGDVVLEFAIAPSGRAHLTKVVKNELREKKFAAAATEALAGWRFKLDGQPRCGLRRGIQTFRFDADGAERTSLGDTALHRAEGELPGAVVGWTAFVTYYQPIRMEMKSAPGVISGTSSAPFRIDTVQRGPGAEGVPPWRAEPAVQLLPSRSHALQAGLYVVAFEVDRDGAPVGPRVLESAGEDLFESLALKAVRNARVSIEAGRPAPALACQIVEFWRN